MLSCKPGKSSFLLFFFIYFVTVNVDWAHYRTVPLMLSVHQELPKKQATKAGDVLLHQLLHRTTQQHLAVSF